ncbi:MAG: S-layer homology domain-containing protein [Oscillospiraceae bacterium]|nr:S-layer homology domain-containing protein [Oscillospiraceae bacterium]
MKKVLSLVLAIAMIMSMTTVAFAADTEETETIYITDITAPYEAVLAAGETATYGGKFTGTTLTISDAADAVVVYNGTTYAADENGVITVEFTASGVASPVKEFTLTSSVDATYSLSFAYPVGSMMNPEALFGIAQINVSIEEGNDQGYYYNWTSRADGTLVISAADYDETKFDVILSSTGSASYPQMSYSEDGTVSIDVKAGDTVTIQVVAVPDSTYNYSAVETTLTGDFIYPVGTQMNPEALFSVEQINVSIEEGNDQGYYYSWYSRGEGTLVLTVGEATEGVEYDVILTNMSNYQMAWLSDSDNGTVSMDVAAGDQVIIQVAVAPDDDWNWPAAEISMTGEMVYPVGTQMNPEYLLSIEQINASIEEGNSQGYYYSWYSRGEGTLVLTMGEATEGVEYEVVMTNMSTYQMAWLQDSDDGTLSLDVAAGDQVIIQVSVYADDSWNYPAAEISMTGEMVYPAGSQMNPEVLTGVEQIDVSLQAGNSQGYYYTWTVETEGTLKLTASSATAGVEYDVILTNMSNYETAWMSDSNDGTVSLDVAAGDEIIIQVVVSPDADWNWPAAEIVLEGQVEVEEEEPVVLVNPFKDVKKKDFYYDAVLWAVNEGITNGYGADDIFNPNGECTRGQIVTFLWRAAGSPEPESTSTTFTDISKKDFYYKAVLWAVENGITDGYGSRYTFNPDGICTRGQVVTFLWRYENKPAPQSSANPFKDVKSGAFYYKAVLWAVENGITNGYGSDDVFNPDGECTRGQIVTFLYRDIA